MAVVFSVAVGGSYYLIRNRQEELKQEVNAGTAGSGLVIPGGMPIGIYLETDGVMVLGTQAVPGTGGIEKEPARNRKEFSYRYRLGFHVYLVPADGQSLCYLRSNAGLAGGHDSHYHLRPHCRLPDKDSAKITASKHCTERCRSSIRYIQAS